MDSKNMPSTNSTKVAHVDAALDEALAESFPASDPVAISFSKPQSPAIAETLASLAMQSNATKLPQDS